MTPPGGTGTGPGQAADMIDLPHACRGRYQPGIMTTSSPPPDRAPAGDAVHRRADRRAWLAPGVAGFVGILLVAAALRSPITGVGPLLATIRADVGLSATGAGVLSMLPLLAFAAVAPLTPAVGRRLGVERALGGALVVLVGGMLLRSTPGTLPLFAGTVVIGAAIGLVNVLLSGLVKRDYPDRVALVTGVYTTVMATFAMLASGLAVPVADTAPGGWRTSLVVWVVVAAVAAVPWLRRPSTRPGASPSLPPATPAAGGPTLWRSPLAWQLTVFFGLQSAGFYIAISWLATILHSRGMGMAAAGWHVALMQTAGLLASAATPAIVRRRPDQSLFATGAAVLGVISYLGLLAAPGFALGWSVTVGLSQGASITLALSFFALRARDAHQAAALSGMGQSVGYLVSASGPLLFGVLYDQTGGWTAPLLFVATLVAAQAMLAFGAGRARHVGGGRGE